MVFSLFLGKPTPPPPPYQLFCPGCHKPVTDIEDLCPGCRKIISKMVM